MYACTNSGAEGDIALHEMTIFVKGELRSCGAARPSDVLIARCTCGQRFTSTRGTKSIEKAPLHLPLLSQLQNLSRLWAPITKKGGAHGVVVYLVC